MIRLNTQAAAEAAAFLLHTPGAVLLVPTETVYGLICKADDPAAIDRIYRMKHRDSAKLLGCFAATTSQLSLKPNAQVQMLVDKYCPGAVTIIAAREDGSTVGFRIPDHPFLQELLDRTGCVLAQTSANRSGRPNALTVDEALAECLKGDETALDRLPDIGVFGEMQRPFNERESIHMEDCRKLFDLLRRVKAAGLLFGVPALVAGAALLKSRKALRMAGWLAPLTILIPLGMLGVWALADFNAAFNFFHEILFRLSPQ